MKKLCLLFAVLFIAVSILPFTVAAASDESVGKIKIYISEYACLLLDGERLEVNGNALYDSDGNRVGSIETVGSYTRKVCILNDGAYTVLNTEFIEIQYLRVEGTSYIDEGARIQYDTVEASTKCVNVGKYDSKKVSLQTLTAEQKTLLAEVVEEAAREEERREMLKKVPLPLLNIFSGEKLNSRTFYVLSEIIQLACGHIVGFKIFCAILFILFFAAQLSLCILVKKPFIVKLLPFLCTCVCAVTAVSYLMDYYGTVYGAKAYDYGMALGLTFWQGIVMSMGVGCLCGLIVATAYQLVCMLVCFIIKKTRAHKAANPQPATEAADAEGAAD